MKLMIKQSSWSGWTEDYKPKEIEKEYNEDNIKLRTYQPFSDCDNGRVNLLSDKKEFTISCGEPLELTTPTMDYGEIFILTLIK